MAKTMPQKYDEHGVRLSREEIEYLRSVWSSDVSSYWDELKRVVPEAQGDADVCRATTIQVWRGTYLFERFWK